MSEPHGAVLLYERCRAYTIASKVIVESMLSPDQKDELIAQLFAPVINHHHEVDWTEIRQAVSRGSVLCRPVPVKPTKDREVEWVLQQRKRRPGSKKSRVRRMGRK